MAYFDNTNDANFYPTSDVPRNVDFYPFLGLTSATEKVDMVNNTTFPDWSMVGQPEPVVYSPTNLWATASNCGER